jgi:hypothetical protein
VNPEEIYAEYKDESNLIVLDADLVMPFMGNRFGVDIEVCLSHRLHQFDRT